jgi:hypothetical protein
MAIKRVQCDPPRMRRNFLLGFVLGVVGMAAVGGLGLAVAAAPPTVTGDSPTVVSYLKPTTAADWTFGQAYYIGTSPNVGSGYFTRSVEVTAPAVTASVLRTGSVEVFVKTDPDINGANWTALPFTFPHAGSAWSYVFAAETFVGKVRVNFFFAGNLSSAPSLSSYTVPDYTIKVVVIPSG